MLSTVKVVLLVVALTGFAGNISFVNGSFCNKEPSNRVAIAVVLPICEYALKQAYQSVNDEICQVIPGYSGEECQKLFDMMNKFGIIDYIVEEAVSYAIETVRQSLTDNDGQTYDYDGQTYDYEELLTKFKNKQKVRSIIAKVIGKCIAYLGSKGIFTVISKAAAHPLGVAGDFAQLYLEVIGYEKEAKIVGAFGNAVGGGLAGFGVGGPLGAVAGAVTGLSVWGIGEYVDNRYYYLDVVESGIDCSSTVASWMHGFWKNSKAYK